MRIAFETAPPGVAQCLCRLRIWALGYCSARMGHEYGVKRIPVCPDANLMIAYIERRGPRAILDTAFRADLRTLRPIDGKTETAQVRDSRSEAAGDECLAYRILPCLRDPAAIGKPGAPIEVGVGIIEGGNEAS